MRPCFRDSQAAVCLLYIIEKGRNRSKRNSIRIRSTSFFRYCPSLFRHVPTRLLFLYIMANSGCFLYAFPPNKPSKTPEGTRRRLTLTPSPNERPRFPPHTESEQPAQNVNGESEKERESQWKRTSVSLFHPPSAPYTPKFLNELRDTHNESFFDIIATHHYLRMNVVCVHVIMIYYCLFVSSFVFASLTLH